MKHCPFYLYFEEDNSMQFPEYRPRRLRKTEHFRRMIRETRLCVDQLIYPMFVVPGEGLKRPINSMPGISQISIDYLVQECSEVQNLGIPAVLLFGIPEKKDDLASEAYATEGIIQRAVQAVKKSVPGILSTVIPISGNRSSKRLSTGCSVNLTGPSVRNGLY